MNIPFVPLSGRVLIEPIEPDRTTESGLVLVEDRKPETMGIVVAVDADATDHQVSVGDTVLFSWVSGQEIMLDDARYLIMPETDLLAIVEEA